MQPGATVRVVNTDTASHNVTAADGAFATETLASGASATFTAPATPGRYAFRCTLHPEMSGALVVAGRQPGAGAGSGGGEPTMSTVVPTIAPRSRLGRRAAPAPGAVATARASSRTAGCWPGLLGVVTRRTGRGRLFVGGPAPLWSQLVTLTGLLAASGLVCAVVLPSRLPALSQSVGITAVLQAHRFVGLFAASMTAAHVGFVIADDPGAVSLLAGSAPPAARAATGAAIAIGGLIVLGVIRHRVRRRYELWRWAHVGLAVASLVLSGLHVLLIDSLVRDGAMRWVLAGLAGLACLVLGYRWLIRPVASSEHVSARGAVRERCGVHARAPAARPAAAVRARPVHLAAAVTGSGVEEHPFTVASGAHVGGCTEITLRCTGDFGRVLAGLPAGAAVWIDGPHGTFSVDFIHAPAVAMIAGGVGITPMMSMLRTLASRRDRRPLVLVRVARHPADLLFGAELAELTGVLDLTVVDVLAPPPSGWMRPWRRRWRAGAGPSPRRSLRPNSPTSSAAHRRWSAAHSTRCGSWACRRTGSTPSSSTS